MKVSKKNAADGKVLLQATATPAEVTAALDAAQVAFAQGMGVRPERDKSVAQLVEEQMGVKDLDSIVQAGAQDALVPLALDAKNLVPLYPPKPDAKTPLRRAVGKDRSAQARFIGKYAARHPDPHRRRNAVPGDSAR